MFTIYKYPIRIDDNLQIHGIPVDAKFRHLDMQAGLIAMWFEVDTEHGLEERAFKVFGTGHRIIVETDTYEQYLGSCMQAPFVWHVYEMVGGDG